MSTTDTDTNTEIRKALESFLDTVEATGGLQTDGNGVLEPVADPEWLDLADAYAEGCRVLGRTPKVANPEQNILSCPRCGHEWPKEDGPPCPKCGY